MNDFKCLNMLRFPMFVVARRPAQEGIDVTERFSVARHAAGPLTDSCMAFVS